MPAVADPNQVDRLSVGRVAVLELSGSTQGDNKAYAIYLGKAGNYDLLVVQDGVADAIKNTRKVTMRNQASEATLREEHNGYSTLNKSPSGERG